MLSIKVQNTKVFLISSVVITSFLFFIDEGAYNFTWALDFGNWVVFIIYSVTILLGQLLVSLILPRVLKGKIHAALSILGGSTLSLYLLMAVLFAN